jgi:molybdate transport system substrate-binding protein
MRHPIRSNRIRPARRASRAALLLLVLAAGLAGGGPAFAGSGSGETGASAEAPRKPLRVLAAASLTEVVDALSRSFEGASITASYGASSDLARQLADGMPGDVFVSASPEWIDFLVEKKATEGDPIVVARNALVCIAPPHGTLAKMGVRDPRAVLAALAPGDLVAIADRGVPAGEYARTALEKLGQAAAFEPRLVGQKDVRAVLHAVEQGEVAAGFVYATDAKVADVVVLFAFEPATHPPIEYQAVVVRQSESPALARGFLTDLSSAAARARLSAAGFVLP